MFGLEKKYEELSEEDKNKYVVGGFILFLLALFLISGVMGALTPHQSVKNNQVVIANNSNEHVDNYSTLDLKKYDLMITNIKNDDINVNELSKGSFVIAMQDGKQYWMTLTNYVAWKNKGLIGLDDDTKHIFNVVDMKIKLRNTEIIEMNVEGNKDEEDKNEVKESDSSNNAFGNYKYCYSSGETSVYHTKDCGHLPKETNRIYSNSVPSELRLCSYCAK